MEIVEHSAAVAADGARPRVLAEQAAGLDGATGRVEVQVAQRLQDSQSGLKMVDQNYYLLLDSC